MSYTVVTNLPETKNFEICKSKHNYYSNKFKGIVDSKKTCKAIREMGHGKINCGNNLCAIDPDDLNEKFINIPMPVIQSNYYDNFKSPFSSNCLFGFKCVRA